MWDQWEKIYLVTTLSFMRAQDISHMVSRNITEHIDRHCHTIRYRRHETIANKSLNKAGQCRRKLTRHGFDACTSRQILPQDNVTEHSLVESRNRVTICHNAG